MSAPQKQEFKITPEMLRAGEEHFPFDTLQNETKGFLTDIFKAMLAASPMSKRLEATHCEMPHNKKRTISSCIMEENFEHERIDYPPYDFELGWKWSPEIIALMEQPSQQPDPLSFRHSRLRRFFQRLKDSLQGLSR